MWGLFRRAPQKERQLILKPSDRRLSVDPGQTILQAALAAGAAWPHNCKVGGCGTCKCRLLSGQVKERTDTSYVLNAEELQLGFILACQSEAKSDVEVEVELVESQAVAPTWRPANIVELKRLNHDIVELGLEVDEPATYQAGQHAQMRVPGVVDEPRCYSFAAAPRPEGDRHLRFFVRRVPGGAFTPWLHEQARVDDQVELSNPTGGFGLRPGTAPMLCVAGGSGLAPIKAILEQALAEGVDRDTTLLFGARQKRDLYCLDSIQNLAERWPARFCFLPVLSEEPEGSAWEGARGLVTEALRQRSHTVAQHQAYLCGPPPMVDAAHEVLTAAGVAADQISCDKFLDKRHTAPATSA